MKTQQHIDALYERRKTAGGFESALIDAYMKADGGNAKLLEDAFKGTRFDLTPKPKFNHGVETLRNAAYWSGNRDEYLNDDKTAYQIIDEYLIRVAPMSVVQGEYIVVIQGHCIHLIPVLLVRALRLLDCDYDCDFLWVAPP